MCRRLLASEEMITAEGTRLTECVKSFAIKKKRSGNRCATWFGPNHAEASVLFLDRKHLLRK